MGEVGRFADHGVGQAGRCVSPRPGGGSADVGSTDRAEMEAVRASLQDRVASVPAREPLATVTVDGEIGADGADVQ